VLTPKAYLPVILTCLVLVFLSACSSVSGIKHVQWTEDLRLSNGRTIVINRLEEYRSVSDVGAGFRSGWLLERSNISAELPGSPARNATWQGSLRPVVLDELHGIVYLVGVPANGRAREEWKLPPHELYAALRLRGDGWERISLEELPSSLQPNLFASSYALFITQDKSSGEHVNLELKRQLDSDPQLDRRYQSIIRIPAPQPK
jgi:hypothetical protein